MRSELIEDHGNNILQVELRVDKMTKFCEIECRFPFHGILRRLTGKLKVHFRNRYR